MDNGNQIPGMDLNDPSKKSLVNPLGSPVGGSGLPTEQPGQIQQQPVQNTGSQPNQQADQPTNQPGNQQDQSAQQTPFQIGFQQVDYNPFEQQPNKTDNGSGLYG